MQLATVPGEVMGAGLVPTLGFQPTGTGVAGAGWKMALDGITAVSGTITAVAAQVIDWSLCGIWTFTMPSGGIAFAPVFKNVTVGQSIVLICTQGSTASTWSWASTTMTTILFAGGTKAPTASSGAIDMVTLTCVAPGVVYGVTDLAMA
jgi:hypothetical protein